jgi:pimeloyl-ACP methyl ester carboxylesterase
MIHALARSRSGHGFLNDLKYRMGDVSKITAPTLVTHSKYDGSVGAGHPEHAAKRIRGARLFMSDAENHMFWYSEFYPEIEAEMARFLR